MGANLDGRKYDVCRAHRGRHYSAARAGCVGSSPPPGPRAAASRRSDRNTRPGGFAPRRREPSGRAPSAGGTLGLPSAPWPRGQSQQVRGDRLHCGYSPSEGPDPSPAAGGRCALTHRRWHMSWSACGYYLTPQFAPGPRCKFGFHHAKRITDESSGRTLSGILTPEVFLACT